jgi:hypothetical protein
MVGDISIRWNSIYDMILRVMRLCIPLQNWLNKQVLLKPDLECLALSSMDWKKLKYLIILLCPFTEYTNLIRNTRNAIINYIWNIYNALFDHLDMMRDQFCYKSIERTPWISEFIMAFDTSNAKLKEYYSKTGGAVKTQYALATLLNPLQKLSIFAVPEWVRPWKKKYTKEFVGYWSANY